jgi:outer membrane receptor protein involved in Fe transport
MYSRKFASAAITAAVMTLGAGAGLAQTSLGILAGVARDQTGAVVPHATVQIINQQNGQKRMAVTQNDGAYRFDSISTGRYTVEVTSTGFQKSVVKDVEVVSTAVTSYDVKLAVGQTSTEVEVEANQGTLDTENGTLTGVVGATEIGKLPIISLSPFELATTVPGVQMVSNGGGFSNGINIQVNGARPRANNFLLDGQEINDVSIGGQAFQPNIPDSYDSLNVITNSASAEYGRAGGAVVNLVTKAGTNTYHGTVFERYTGSGLNSVPGGYRGSPFVKTRYDQHNYGFTAGGPIIKDKLFAFGALQLSRYYGSETPGVNLLPDAAGYATLQTISGTPMAQVAILDQYLNNGSYLNTDLSYTPVDATGAATTYQLNVGALPGCPAGGCQVSFAGFQRPSVHENNPDTQWEYRVDYHPRDKDSVGFRYLHDRSSLTPDFFNNPNALAGFDTDQGGPAELGEGFWTHIFSPTLENEFRVGETRIAYLFSPTAETSANPLNALPSLSFSSLQTGTTAGTLSFPTLGPNQNFPQGRREDLYQFQDTVGWTKGRQSFRIGADIGRQIEIDIVSQNAIGTEAFVKGGSGVSSLGNFLLDQTGPSGTVTKTFGPTRDDAHDYRNGAFIQDDVKFSSDLTMNFGFRWDYLSDPENSLKYPGIDPNNVFAPINTVVRIKPDYSDFSPRFGFAYAPHSGIFRDGKTVVRGGFGIFYDSTFSNILVNSTQSSPNSVAFDDEVTTGNGIANPAADLASAVAVLSPLSSVESEVSNFRNPITYQYNLGVERELPGENVLAIRYIGDRGDKLYANQQYNYFANGARLNPNRGAIVARGNFAASEYNSAIVEFTHNFRHDFLVKANYVFSKDLDDGSEVFTTFSSPTSYSANLAPGGRGQDWGPSAYDHRQYFSVAYVWEPKGLRSGNKILDGAEGVLTRRWTVAGVSQLQSGAYATFSTSGLDTNGDGSTANDRPIIGSYSAPLGTVGIDGTYVGGTPGTYYDLSQANTTGAVVPVNPGSVRFLVPYGPQNQFLHQELGRNSYQLPGTTTHNLSLEKGFGLSYLHFERGTLVFRAEGQNIFNHNDGNQPDTDTLDAGAGFLAPSKQTTNRTLILWAKLQF